MPVVSKNTKAVFKHTNTMERRRSLYQFAKKHELPVSWKTNVNQMQTVVDDFKQTKAKTIYKALNSMKMKSDNATKNSVNTLTGTVNMSYERFKRIRASISAPADKKLLLHIKNDYGVTIRTYHLNDRILNIDNLFIDQENQYSSGADESLNITPTSMISLEWLDNPKYSKSERKAFFRYLTNANYGLESFQVYGEVNAVNTRKADYPCFLHALTEAGLESNIVKQISQTMYTGGTTIDFIRKTAVNFNLYISVKQYFSKKDGVANNKISNYGVKDSICIKLGSVGCHLFAIKPTNITKAALDNPEMVKQLNRTDFILKNNKPSFNSCRIKLLDSYEVISYLYHHKDTYLSCITQQNMPYLLNSKYAEVRELHLSDFNDKNFRQLGRVDGKLKLGRPPFKIYNREHEIMEEDNSYNVVYFDFETLVKDGQHIPYCVSFSIATKDGIFSKTENIYGFDCAKQFLNKLPPKSNNLLLAHNAGFDCRFILEHLYFDSRDANMIDCGTKVKQACGVFFGRKIIVKDTMSFIAGSLSSLPSMFKDAVGSLSLEKESFPHELINEDNYCSMWPISYLDQYEGKDVLIENAGKIGAIQNEMFDCKKYATHYCNRDVDVLRLCFEAFRKMTLEAFNLDVYNFLSISSISLAYQHNEGCFDECFEMNSVLLGFLREATVGGRVMTRDNQKHHIKHKLADFDAVSLYPSAMAELKGYVKGKGNLFKDNIPEDADYYVARISIDKIGKDYHFPLLSYFDNGSRNFTNDLAGRTMIVGKQALEDIVEFQKASYTVIEGIYWNEGFNDQITHTIRKMFNERLKYKSEGNALQLVLKLMMNSSYGKLLMKPITSQKVFVSGKESIQKYTSKSIHKMITRTPINARLSLFEEHKSLTSHFSPVHLGIQVLDSSKHIMNRVMCLAEDIKADIWYQDTDSMMIDYEAVERLAIVYKEKYSKELIGNQMGQFHVDFDLPGSKGEIFSKESIFLGKKSYLAMLACDGNDVEGMHIRMKGIPSKLLEENAYKQYIKLYNGEKLSFDLSQLCSINIDTKSQKVTKRSSFTRNISF